MTAFNAKTAQKWVNNLRFLLNKPPITRWQSFAAKKINCGRNPTRLIQHLRGTHLTLHVLVQLEIKIEKKTLWILLCAFCD